MPRKGVRKGAGKTLKQYLKNLLLGSGRKPRRVLLGPGRDITLLLDPACESQRLLGLAEAEIVGHFVEMSTSASTFCDVGASDGWYCLLARKHNPAIKLIAFEPDQLLGRRAMRNLELNRISPDDSVAWIVDYCGTNHVSLDAALPTAKEPIFLKVDIEGAELD